MNFIQIKNDALVSRLGQAADRMGTPHHYRQQLQIHLQP